MIKNLKVGNASIVETGNIFGNMNTSRLFYPEECTSEERARIFLERRMRVGRAFGFDGHKMFMADQKDKSGSWFEITDDYVAEHPNGWSDIDQDILIITDKTPGVVIGHPVADCPVVMAFDRRKGVTAVAHCSAELVDKRMPMLLIDALLDSNRSSEEDITTYVSACAGRSWTYDRYPGWAKDDKIWGRHIVLGEDGLFHIDLKSAVVEQLRSRGVSDIILSKVDTITDPEFYSNSEARKNVKKKGRNFAGTFYR